MVQKKSNKSSGKKSDNTNSVRIRKLNALNKCLDEEGKITNLYYKMITQQITKLILQGLIKEMRVVDFFYVLQYIME